MPFLDNNKKKKSLRSTEPSFKHRDCIFLVTLTCNQSPRWTATVQVREVPIVFKVDDTVVDVTVIPAETYGTHFSPTSLQRPTKVLKGPGRYELDVLGIITEDITYRAKLTKADLYVVNNLDQSLLSRDANERLGIVRKIYDVTASQAGNTKP